MQRRNWFDDLARRLADDSGLARRRLKPRTGRVLGRRGLVKWTAAGIAGLVGNAAIWSNGRGPSAPVADAGVVGCGPEENCSLNGFCDYRTCDCFDEFSGQFCDQCAPDHYG